MSIKNGGNFTQKYHNFLRPPGFLTTETWFVYATVFYSVCNWVWYLNHFFILYFPRSYFWCSQIAKLIKKKLYFSNIVIAILDFSLLLPFSYHSSNFVIGKVVALNFFALLFICFVHWFMASFLYCSPYSYRSSNYRSFSILKEAKKMKSDNVTRSIREKSSSAIAILVKLIIW